MLMTMLMTMLIEVVLMMKEGLILKQREFEIVSKMMRTLTKTEKMKKLIVSKVRTWT
jgi:hypothetical protein